QYRSRIFYINKEQGKIAKRSMEEREGNIETTIEPLKDFYLAEDYHQKYRLRHSKLFSDIDELSEMDADEFRDSKLAAKANAVAAGYLERKKLEEFEG
ncbi:MAG: peptide-methionine (S)-S-oxide reductase, partial [Candidatus Aenigmatarchaeota archaeon]